MQRYILSLLENTESGSYHITLISKYYRCQKRSTRMSSTTNTSQQPLNRHFVSSVVTLSLWRWRQQWFLLLMIGIGMIAAVTIVCTIPLLSSTMQTAGLRNVLRATPNSSEVALRAQVGGLSTQG